MAWRTVCGRIFPGLVLGCMFLALLPGPAPGSGAETEETAPHRKEGAETGEMPDTAGSGGEIPLEWIEEILANQEILESMELLENYEFFEKKKRFSPHHFE